jgi:hypothetical protein
MLGKILIGNIGAIKLLLSVPGPGAEAGDGQDIATKRSDPVDAHGGRVAGGFLSSLLP